MIYGRSCREPWLHVWSDFERNVMAGRGPAPKDSSRRVRYSSQPATTMLLEVAPRPPMPPSQPDGSPWPERTLIWWEVWGRSAQSAFFSETEWDYLIDTAVIHAKFWTSGRVDYAGELRLRVAKFGATLEDRARLRMATADADKADASRPESERSPAAQRRGELVALHAVEA